MCNKAWTIFSGQGTAREHPIKCDSSSGRFSKSETGPTKQNYYQRNHYKKITASIGNSFIDTL